MTIENPYFIDEKLAPERIKRKVLAGLRDQLNSVRADLQDDEEDKDDLCNEILILDRISDFLVKTGVVSKEESDRALGKNNHNGHSQRR